MGSACSWLLSVLFLLVSLSCLLWCLRFSFFSWCAWWHRFLRWSSCLVLLGSFSGSFCLAWSFPVSLADLCLHGSLVLLECSGSFLALRCPCTFVCPCLPGLDASPLALRFSLGLTSWWIPWQCLVGIAFVCGLPLLFLGVALACLLSGLGWSERVLDCFILVGLSLLPLALVKLPVLLLVALPFPCRCLVLAVALVSWNVS